MDKQFKEENKKIRQIDDPRIKPYLVLKYHLGRETLDKEAPIPFHQTLARLSPLYRRNWDVARLLDHHLQPKVATLVRLYLEFDPFSMSIDYPKTLENMHWLLNFNRPKMILDELTTVANYNWSVYHDIFHLNLISLVPCRDKAQLEQYFHFFEAFVGIQENLLTSQLPKDLYQALVYINMLNPAPKIAEHPVESSPADFVALMLNRFNDRLKLDADESFVEAKNEISRVWYRRYMHKHRAYPAHLLRRKVAGLPRFEFPSFDVRYLRKNPDVLKDFLDWYVDLFWKNSDPGA